MLKMRISTNTYTLAGFGKKCSLKREIETGSKTFRAHASQKWP